MDPVSTQGANLASAVQALLVRQGTVVESSALMALLGQDLEVLFQALTAEGAQLKLPSGQLLLAQGELPYPEGSRLRVRLLPAVSGDAHLRLQLQEARPPEPPALLSPLVQSEAQTLAARLGQALPAPELEPLLRLLNLLADPQPGVVKLPTPDQLQTALRDLPEPMLAGLGRALGLGGLASPRELAATLLPLLEEAQAEQAAGHARDRLLRLGSGTAPAEAEATKSLDAMLLHVMARLQPLPAGAPPEDRDGLATLIRNLLHKAAEVPVPPRPAAPATRTELPARGAEASIPPKLTAVLGLHTGPKAELPETWETWIRGTIQTLADPAISPREAPFHALQAKESTAFFEIPLPWAQVGPLQIWVEAEAPEEQRGISDPTKRVLLGLNFSQLGETRLGLAQGSFGLQVRVWSEHPEVLESQRESLQRELEELGKAVDLRIYALLYGPDGTIPSLRSLVAGPSLSALG